MPAEELIAEHRKMVLGLASRLRRELSLSGDLEDLVAFGFGGLLEAERRYDPNRGVRFQTFAYYRVRGAMLDGVRQMADLPRRAHERLKAAQEAPTTAAPSPLDKAFARISARLTSPIPVQSSYGVLSPEVALLKNESVERLLQALSALPPRERALIRGRYFEGRSLDALAGELGISKSWASRIHRRALESLRAALQGP
jgi:RNA polymerase sigma factor for flagellar operon FliA